MTQRPAILNDCALLAELNHRLIRDEGHLNKMTVPELEQRMKGWLVSEYVAVIFEDCEEVVAYALYREQPEEIYLRQPFVARNRRRQGIGRQAFEILRSKIWPANKRLTVEVLVKNETAGAFWRAVGCKDYSLKLEIRPEKNLYYVQYEQATHRRRAGTLRASRPFEVRRASDACLQSAGLRAGGT